MRMEQIDILLLYKICFEIQPLIKIKLKFFSLNLKKFLFFIYQCNLKACKNAERPSIKSKTPTVKTAHAVNTKNSIIKP